MIPYYDHVGITIYHGDCLEIMPTLPDKSIDMILCDLPYGTTACKWDTVIPFEPLWKQYKRLIKDNGAIVLFGSEPFSSFLRISNIKQFRYDWIWDKDKAHGALLANKMPLKRHEIVSVFYGALPTYNPRMEKAQPNRIRPLSNANIYGCINNITNKQDNKTSVNYNPNLRFPNSILQFSSALGDCNSANRTHPTQKPVALFEYLIRTYTNEGDTVLDNCAGSGTTGVACLNTGRKAILIEREEKYCEIAVKRLQQEVLPL